MGPFQDEPDERPKQCRRLFMDEPEELCARPVSRRSSRASSSSRPTLFGAEPEEQVGQFDRGGQDSSSDDEVPQRTLNVSWSAFALFDKAMFMKEVSKAGKPEVKKRPYDNTRRTQKASEVSKTERHSYKDNALNKDRLLHLAKATGCKCYLYELGNWFR